MSQRQSVFIPNDMMGSRKETATLLVGTAREFGIAQRDIASTFNGFFITPELEALIYDEGEDDEVADAGQVGETAGEIAADLVTDTTETSGNRAAKNTKTQKGK